MKLKSIKPPFGYFRYIWYEEWNQFGGMQETRSINQSLMRGGERFTVFTHTTHRNPFGTG